MKAKSLLLLSSLACVALTAWAEEKVIPVAVLDFESTDKAVADLGPKAAALINVELSADPRLMTLERGELLKAIGEQEMGLSGTIKPETAAKVGHLTGAKVLVTGKVFPVDRELFIVAKVIGTETSRVYGELVKADANAPLSGMCSEMSKKLAATITEKIATLVAKEEKIEDRIERVRKSLRTDKLPVVEVRVAERHVGTATTIDPAAETEVAYFLKNCGFTVVEPQSRQKPQIEFVGEGFSEFALRKGNLISCKARVELKAVEKSTGKVLAVDRQTSVAVDLSEQIAAKTALQMAAQQIAERIIPQTVK